MAFVIRSHILIAILECLLKVLLVNEDELAYRMEKFEFPQNYNFIMQRINIKYP